MVEWSITTVLKTVVLRGTGGSNPSLSAKRDVRLLLDVYFFAAANRVLTFFQSLRPSFDISIVCVLSCERWLNDV